MPDIVDGSAPELIRSLKKQLGDQVNYEEQIDRIKKQFPGCDYESQMLVVPVHFAKEHKEMLAHCKKLMEYNNGQVAINPKFEKLAISLHTAYDKGESGIRSKQAIMISLMRLDYRYAFIDS